MAGLAVAETTDADHGRIGMRRAHASHDPLSSRPLTAAVYLAADRSHWSIENGLHGVLDITFDEDRARSRKDEAAKTMRRKT